MSLSLYQSTSLILLTLISVAVAPAPPPRCGPDSTNDPACGIFEWGTIGDSWDSGVAYSTDVAYDNNKDDCLRIKHAYGAQMEADKSWTRGRQKFHFAGCSGARLVNMYRENGQIGNTGKPQVILMTAGGNNVHFGDIADNCVFHGHPENLFGYGAPYDKDPEGKGSCKISLNEAQLYLDDPRFGLGYDLHETINDIFTKSDQAKSHSQFWLYVTSYAHFFNTDTDWCDKVTFAPWYAYWKPELVKELRRVLNGKLEQVNNIYADVIAKYKPPEHMHIGYIPITQGYDEHRFCEPHHTFQDQWYSDDVYIWNFGLRRNGQELIMPVETYDNGTRYMGRADGDSQDNYVLTGGSGPGRISQGSLIRTFHPKEKGFKVVKDAAIARLRADKVTGVK